MRKLNIQVWLLALISMVMAMPGFAIDYWTIGKVQAVMAGGEETAEAGYVYVAAEAVESASDISGVTSSMQTDPVVLSGAAGSSAINKEYYFYAKANTGYTFVGFASTATGTPSGAGLAEGLAMVGDYYSYSAKAGAGWSGNTEETAKVFARYAVFEKDDNGEQGGEQGGQDEDDPATEAKVVAVTNQFGKNLIDAVLTANTGDNLEDGDIVTHIYITFDHELKEISSMSAHQALASAVTIVNTTTGKALEFNQYSCGVKSSDKHTLDMLLSSECYINSANYQGVYVVSLPAGVATTTNELPTEAYSFTFTYGDASDAPVEKLVNFDDYLGNWKQTIDVDEIIENPAAFSFEKIGDGYFMTNLYATTLRIPVSVENYKYYFANTQDDKYSFVSSTGTSVEALFEESNGTKQIYLGQFSILSASFDQPLVGGICYFEYTDEAIPSAITSIEAGHSEQAVYDLQGRRLAAPAKGINIVNGKKLIAK